MIGLIGGALPILLKLIGFFIDKGKSSDEMKTAFMSLVKAYEQNSGNSIKVSNSIREQIENEKKNA